MTFAIQPDGLVVDVVIAPDANQMQQWQAQGQPIPRPLRVRGVMDTASDVTAVAPHVFQALGLSSTRSAQTHTASGMVNPKVYEISLSIVQASGAGPMYTAPQLTVTELFHAAPGIDVLIGLDIILQGILHIAGPGRTFSFTW
jgi:hypothetical protein